MAERIDVLFVDYCNMVLASSPMSIANKLQWVLSAVARLVSGAHKYDRRLSQVLYVDLHQLAVSDRFLYRLFSTVHRYLHNKVLQCLVDYCVPVSDIASHQ